MIPRTNTKKTRKPAFIPSFALAVLAALLSARCSSPREKTQEKTELLVGILRESGLEGADLEPLIGEYVTAHPKLLVNTETVSFEDLLRGDSDPADILIFDGRYLRDLVDAGALLALEDYPHSGSPLDRWALPLNASVDLLFYNVGLLKGAGFDRPPGTRAEYLQYARALRDRGGGGIYGSALGLGREDSRGLYRDVLSWVWASGAVLVQDGELDFSGRALNGALDFLAALENEGLLAPGSFEKSGGQRMGEFAEGKIGMLIGSVRDIPGLQEKMGADAFGVTRIPEPEDYPGKPVFGLWVWYGALSRQSARREAAEDLLLFFRERGSVLTEQLKTVPGHNESASLGLEDPLYAKIWDIYEGADLTRELLDFPGEAALEEVLRRELEVMFREKRGGAETALAVQRGWPE